MSLYCNCRHIFGAALAIALLTISPATAQTFAVLHAFSGGGDGANPIGAGLVMDRGGNLYGATVDGGMVRPNCAGNETGSCGTVFRMSRRGSGWILSTLYEFTGGTDGYAPDAPIAFGPDGAIYSTTFYGGGNGCFLNGCGVVFKLQPSPMTCRNVHCPWLETVLYRFLGPVDGSQPAFGALAFDQSGNMYGTATQSGAYAQGTVFELTATGGQWMLNVLYSFTGQLDGGSPWSGVTFDSAGDLYGTTTTDGEYTGGTVFELIREGESWTLSTLHQFVPATDGDSSFGNLLFDAFGNLWGTTRFGGAGQAGTAWELSPSNGEWNLNVLHSFTGGTYGPQAPLVRDHAGNLYGTSLNGGQYHQGSVFELTPINGSWNYTVLHDFTGGSDGAEPYSAIVLDASGNIYGTAFAGGTTGGGICGTLGCGVVWEITP
jgi:hypothetical protein